MTDMTITIPERITLKTGHGGLSYFELRCSGAEAHVYLHGAHVLHYQPAGQAPVLWQSRKSFFEPGKPIRGGIPVCWPWFGAHPESGGRPIHGLARITGWTPTASSATADATSLTLQMPALPGIQAAAELTVVLADDLQVSLTTTNAGSEPLTLSEALHSYFAVCDIRNVSVHGLEGEQYIDTLPASLPVLTQRGPITFTEETDRIYINTSRECSIHDPAMKRRIRISKSGSQSTVVWNPWIDKSIRMPDFGDNEYTEMVCIETANCGPNTLSLPPGGRHTITTRIRSDRA